MTARRLPATTLLCAILSSPSSAGAQAPATVWERSVEVAGNYFYGAREQSLLSLRTGVIRNDSTASVRFDTRYLVGVTDQADGRRVMDRRSWLLSGALDFQPYARYSQFIFASLERSLELRIDRRSSGGFGQKVTFANDSVQQFDFSLGILGERSQLPQQVAPGAPPLPVLSTSLVRLSGRLRYRRTIADRLTVDHSTSYRPQVDAFGRYLGSSITALRYAIAKKSHVEVSFQNELDSQATSRGARSNNNGQILIGASTSF